MATEKRSKPLFKEGDVVFTTLNRKKLNLIAKYTFGEVTKIRWRKSGYKYYVFFEPTRIRPLVCIFKTDVWLNEADLLPKSEYAKYYLRKKIKRFEDAVERLRTRIQGDKNQLLESRKEVEHLENMLHKLRTQ